MNVFPGFDSAQSPQNNDCHQEAGKISAYYSLVFPHFTFYIQTLDVTIGRRTIRTCSSPSSSSAPSMDNSQQVDVDLGTLKSVSRLHARIEYDQDMDQFVLAVIGRNGAWVDGVWSASGTRAPLGERSQIQIASRTFEFVLPPPSPPEDSPSPSSRSSTNRHRSPSLDITSISPPSSLLSQSPAPPHKPKHPPDVIPKLSSKAISKKRKKRDEPPAVPDAPHSIKPKLHPEEVPRKPPYTYAQLIYKALKGIDEKATLQEICAWIMEKFDYYKRTDASWMSSVRHNLSSGRAFKKLERCGGERGKGNFWCLDETVEHHLDDGDLDEGISVDGKDDSKRSQRNPPLPPPLTYAPRAISGPATNPAPVVQGVPPQVPSGKVTGPTGVFAYPYPSNPNQNPYATLVHWTPQPGGQAASVSGQPSSSASLPAPSAAVSQSKSELAVKPNTSTTPAEKHSTPNISISIVLGPIPPSHPEYSPSHPNNSKTEGYIIWDGRTIVLDPVVFSNLTKQTLQEYEGMGAQEAVKLLSKQAARARRAKNGGGVRPRGKKGGSVATGVKKMKPKPLGNTPSDVPLPALSNLNESTVQGARPPPLPIDDEAATIVIIDDSDEEPAAKRQKLDTSSRTVHDGATGS